MRAWMMKFLSAVVAVCVGGVPMVHAASPEAFSERVSREASFEVVVRALCDGTYDEGGARRIVELIGCDGMRALLGLPQYTAFAGVAIGGGVGATLGSLFIGVSAPAVIAVVGAVAGVVATVWCIAQWAWCKRSIGDITTAVRSFIASKNVTSVAIARLPQPVSPREHQAVQRAMDNHLRTQWVRDVKSSDAPWQLLEKSVFTLEKSKEVASALPKGNRVNNGKTESRPPSKRPEPSPESSGGKAGGVDNFCSKTVGNDLYTSSPLRKERIKKLKEEIDLLLAYVQQFLSSEIKKLNTPAEKVALQKQVNEWIKNAQIATCLSEFNEKYLPGQNSEYILSTIKNEILFGFFGSKVRGALDQDVKAGKVVVVRDHVRSDVPSKGKNRYVRVRK